jgi:hypothetical protein
MLVVQQELVLEVKLVGRHMMAKICVYSFNNLNFLEPLIPKVQMIKWMLIQKKFGNESIANLLYFVMIQKYDF